MGRFRLVLLSVLLVAGIGTRVAAQYPTADTLTQFKIAAFRRAADSLMALDPAKAVAAAVRDGDRHLWGIQGYTLVVPGVHSDDYHKYKRRLGFRAMPNTSDGILGPDHAYYIAAAARYAREYNRILLCRLRLRSQ